MKRFFGIIFDEEKGEMRCEKCGEILAPTAEEYLRKWTNSSEMWAIQLMREHKDNCSVRIEEAKRKAEVAKTYGAEVDYRELI